MSLKPEETAPWMPLTVRLREQWAIMQRQCKSHNCDGQVWLCLVWFGLAWLVLVWFGLVWLGWFVWVWFGLVWVGLVGFGLVWFGLAWLGLVWFGLVWLGLVGFGVVWFGLVPAWLPAAAIPMGWGAISLKLCLTWRCQGGTVATPPILTPSSLRF